MGQQEETRSIAAHDSLTKIYNFTAFCESSRKYLLSAGAGGRRETASLSPCL